MRRVSSAPFLDRRTMLRGLGVSLGLPVLEAMFPSALRANPSAFQPWASSSTAPKPRAIFCYIPNGVNILEWMPKDSGKSYGLPPTLAGMAAHRDDFTLITGLGHPRSPGGHNGADTWLTAADLKSTPGKDYTNSISIDQVIAEKIGRETRLPSLELSDQSGSGTAGHSHTLSFSRSGTPLPAEDSPRRVFERLFVPDDATSREATLRRYAQKKSILDDIRSEAADLQQKLGAEDKSKLDEYLTSVRETEQRVDRLTQWVDVPKATVDSHDLQLSSQPGNAHDRPMWIDVMMELNYLAFATDTTRVITFEWSREAGGFGGGGENHHELSHHGGDPGMLKRLAEIDRFHVSRLTRFLDFLKRTQEGGGTMLDHTVIVFGSGMNSGETGDHSPKNLPLLVAGGKAFGFQHGQHLAHPQDSHPPLSNVLLSVAQKMGVDSGEFADATGTLTGLV